MRQEDVLNLLRERGPMTAREIAHTLEPDAPEYRSISNTRRCLRKLGLWEDVESDVIHRCGAAVTKIWRAVE